MSLSPDSCFLLSQQPHVEYRLWACPFCADSRRALESPPVAQLDDGFGADGTDGERRYSEKWKDRVRLSSFFSETSPDDEHPYRYHNMCRFYSGVRSHIFFARRPSRLTILISNSITTHYYKITVTTGASSASSFSRRSFTLVHLTSVGLKRTIIATSTLTRSPSCARTKKNTVRSSRISLVYQTTNPTPFNPGFVLSMPEDSRSIESLWPTVKGTPSLPNSQTRAHVLLSYQSS